MYFFLYILYTRGYEKFGISAYKKHIFNNLDDITNDLKQDIEDVFN